MKTKKPVVEFVSYSGEYPNLCSGILVLKVNGKEFIFAAHSLHSLGGCNYDRASGSVETTTGPWEIADYPKRFPENAKKIAVKIVNENIEHGCCGGCE